MEDDIVRQTAEAAPQREPEQFKLSVARPMPQFVASVTRRAISPAFPTAQSASVTQTPGSTGGNTTNFSFRLENASVGDSPKVLINDGEINGEVPIGMGTDTYVLDVYDGAFVVCTITYDSVTLAITSTSFSAAASMPTSTLGVLYIEIGRIFVDFDDQGHIASFTAVNTQCGDINVAFVYGALNGVPALLPVTVYGDWVPLV